MQVGVSPSLLLTRKVIFFVPNESQVRLCAEGTLLLSSLIISDISHLYQSHVDINPINPM